MTSRTVGQVVGATLADMRRRRGLTQEEVARLCRTVGLSWTRVRVAAIERGDRETVDVGTLLLLAEAFGVALSELFGGTANVRLSNDAHHSTADVRAALSGGGADRQLAQPSSPPTEADRALAERLGVPPGAVVEAAIELWGRSLTEERDRRVAALGEMERGERQAHRGHVTRELSRTVEARLSA